MPLLDHVLKKLFLGISPFPLPLSPLSAPPPLALLKKMFKNCAYKIKKIVKLLDEEHSRTQGFFREK